MRKHPGFKHHLQNLSKEIVKQCYWSTAMKVELFEGCSPGNRVIVKLGGALINTRWISEITSLEQNDFEICFTDIGYELPFPLKKWEHKHRIIIISEHRCKIIDDIIYHTSYVWLDRIIKPFLMIQFGIRKKAYSTYFQSYVRE